MGRARSHSGGQVLVIFALASLVMFGMAAIAIDQGIAMQDRRGLQVIADSAALAGALSYTGASTRQAANFVAMEYVVKSVGGSVPSGCSAATSCPQGTYTVGNYTIRFIDDDADTTIDVDISHSRRSLIAGFLGFDTVVDGSSARAQPPSSAAASPAILGLSTDCGAHPPAINITGGSSVAVNGAAYADGAFDDSNSASVTVNGNADTTCQTFTSDQPAYGDGGTGVTNASALPDPGLPQPSSPSATSQSPDCPSYSSDCNLNNNSSFSPELGPQQFGSKLNFSGGCWFLDPGVYEFDGGGGFQVSGAYVTNELVSPAVGATGDLWTQAKASVGVDCSMVGSVTSSHSTGSLSAAQTYSLEFTSTRTDGPGRESAVSGCLQVSGATGYTITIPNVPGAQGYNVYAGTGGCSGSFALEASVTVAGRSSEREGSLGSTTASFASFNVGAAPPSTDQANEGYSVGRSSTPGAVAISVPAANTGDPGVSITSGGTYLFSGFQYGGVIVYDGRNSGSHCWSNCNDTTTGGSGTHLVGFVYAPHSQVSLTGGGGTTVLGEVVGLEVTITGGTGTAITSDNRFAAQQANGLIR